VRGLASSGPKSVIAPTPIKITRGATPLPMATSVKAVQHAVAVTQIARPDAAHQAARPSERPRGQPRSAAGSGGTAKSDDASAASTAASRSAGPLVQCRERKSRTGNIGQQSTKADGHEQQRLESGGEWPGTEEAGRRPASRPLNPASSWASPRRTRVARTGPSIGAQGQQLVSHGDRIARGHRDRRTVPARGARTSVSIFMASSISTTSPASTRSPLARRRLTMLPARGALTGTPAAHRQAGAGLHARPRAMQHATSPRRLH
jgi:hypothetical protein